MDNKITVLVPTTSLPEREMLLRDVVLPGVIKQTTRGGIDIILIANNRATALINVVNPIRKVLGNRGLRDNSSISCLEHRGSIFEKLFHATPSIESEFICLLDDDIEIIDSNFFQHALSMLNTDTNIAVISTYIDVGQSKQSFSNRLNYGINRFFTVWGYQDAQMRVLNPFSRGQPLHPGVIVSQSQWVPNNACIVRTSLLKQRLVEMREEVDFVTKASNGQINSHNMWAVDFFMFFPFALAGLSIVYLTTLKAVHWGHETSFGFFRRISIETLWGYYYFIRFFRNGLFSFLRKFVWPNIGRLVRYLVMSFSPRFTRTGLKALITLCSSYISLFVLIIRTSNFSSK